MTKCKKGLIGFVLVASIVFGGCDTISGGSYCDDKEGQNLFTKLLKEYLLENQKKLQEHIDKVSFSYEIDKEHSTINEDEQSAACFIKNITIKFDKGDSVIIDAALDDKTKEVMKTFGAFAALADGQYQLVNEIEKIPSLFMYIVGYKENKRTKQTRIEVIAPTLSYNAFDVFDMLGLKDISQNIIDYYNGTGVLINGKRKGACPDGIRQTRDKNGEIAFEGGCTNGTKEGAWKYYENGFLSKEELYKNGLLDKATVYYPTTGKIKATYTTDDNGNSKYIEYKENGLIEKIIPYSKNTKGNMVANGKVFGKSYDIQRDFGKLKMETCLGCDNEAAYTEVSNGKIVLKRLYDYGDVTGKTEQEVFKNIDKATPNSYEVIVLGNLALLVWGDFRFYKNDEVVGILSTDYGAGIKSEGYCTTGQCQVMFKELIDKSFYKDKIYSALESAKPAKE